MRGLFLKEHARGRFKYVQFYDEHDEGTNIQRICLSNSINLDQIFSRGKGGMLDASSVFHQKRIFKWKVSIMGGLLSEDMRKLGSSFLLKPTSSAKLSVCDAVSIDFWFSFWRNFNSRMTAHSQKMSQNNLMQIKWHSITSLANKFVCNVSFSWVTGHSKHCS